MRTSACVEKAAFAAALGARMCLWHILYSNNRNGKFTDM